MVHHILHLARLERQTQRRPHLHPTLPSPAQHDLPTARRPHHLPSPHFPQSPDHAGNGYAVTVRHPRMDLARERVAEIRDQPLGDSELRGRAGGGGGRRRVDGGVCAEIDVYARGAEYLYAGQQLSGVERSTERFGEQGDWQIDGRITGCHSGVTIQRVPRRRARAQNLQSS